MTPAPASDFAADVLAGLARDPKSIPPRWFYDAIGSALFDVITLLDEYGATRAEARLLQTHARELAGRFDGVLELGAGSGAKTRYLLAALGSRTRYVPVDVSRAALEQNAVALNALADVKPYCGTWDSALARISDTRTGRQRWLVLFLGSSIGNLAPEERQIFFANVRAALAPGDAMLTGFDLVKPRDVLVRAYDDGAGVTAAFNKNLLTRINRELGGGFDPAAFRHRAVWRRDLEAVEMRLVARRALAVTVAGREFSFRKGESLLTEQSFKFREDRLDAMARAAGFAPAARWSDREWGFCDAVWTAV